MNIRRTLSYLAVVILGILLWTTWVKEHPEKPASEMESSQQQTETKSDSSFYAPPQAAPSGKPAKQKAQHKIISEEAKGNFVDVKTDVLDVQINLNGGNIASTKLPKYTVSVQNNNPITLLSSDPGKFYVAQSGLQKENGQVLKLKFQAQQSNFTLSPDSKQLTVNLTGQTASGLKVIKSYTFTRNSYAVKVNYTLQNVAGGNWQGRVFTQLIRKKQPSKGHLFVARSYDGASVSSPETPYEKITFKDMEKSNLNRSNPGGWVAMQQHYFLSAWIPESQKQKNTFYSKADADKELYMIGFLGPEVSVPKGATETTQATLYMGPELPKALSKLAPGLDRTVDYGWLWWVSVVIFWLMNLVHTIVGNWGWAIVITTIIIKFILYPLSATSFRSMARMRELQPKMQQLKEKFGDDRQAMSRATMELYRKEKINPLGGCLPMIIQIPIFIGLYYVIIESVQLRQAPFIFWIQDLSVKDPYYVLPILMGASMVLQQKLAPSSPDPAQARMMMFIPVVFTIFFLSFPAGLTLYWLVNNCVQILQQWYVTKHFEAHKAKKARKAKARKKKKNKPFKLR